MIRSDGFTRLEEVEAVILEIDGSFSVLERDTQNKATTLSNVEGMPDGNGDPEPAKRRRYIET